MNAPDTSPIEGTPFEQIVRDIEWLPSQAPDGLAPDRLRIIGHLGGWLVHADEDGGASLVGFSIEAVDTDEPLLPPRDIAEVSQHLGHSLLSPLNSDALGKGLGSLIANTPQALQPHTTQNSDIAVRMIPLVRGEIIDERRDSQTGLGRRYGEARHGSLLVMSTVIDKLTQSTVGTAAAVRFLERKYNRDARLVGMQPAPVWQDEYRRHHIEQPVPPRVMLVRGGRFAEQNVMTRVGTYSAHRNR